MNLPKLKIGDKIASLPIIQGGMAVRISLAPLAAAVANEGGIGVIAASGLHPPELVSNIQQAKKMTNGIIGVNIMVALSEFAELVNVSIREKVDLIIAGAGFSRDVFKWGKEANIPIVPIVSSERVAKLAERFGASAVIVEGKEAGGHLGTFDSLFSVLPGIVNAVKIPVIAAGGILHGADIKKALSLGASGVQLGSRFAASEESSAAPEWKEAFIKARKEDVVIIESPVGMPGRAIYTPFVELLLAGRAPKPKTYKKCVKCLKDCKRNYCIIDALVRAQQGDVENGIVFAGERVGEIDDILPVKKIIQKLVDEFKASTAEVV